MSSAMRRSARSMISSDSIRTTSIPRQKKPQRVVDTAAGFPAEAHAPAAEARKRFHSTSAASTFPTFRAAEDMREAAHAKPAAAVLAAASATSSAGYFPADRRRAPRDREPTSSTR